MDWQIVRKDGKFLSIVEDTVSTPYWDDNLQYACIFKNNIAVQVYQQDYPDMLKGATVHRLTWGETISVL
jgi:hypothetical protein